MNLKVSLFSSKVRRQYAGIVAVISAVASFYFITVQVPTEQRTDYIVTATIALVSLYLGIWVLANLKRRAKLNINNSNVFIKFGDIFEQKGLKAISFNEYFDTVADDALISKSSLNGKYVLSLNKEQLKSLDERIANDPRLKERQIDPKGRRAVGKKVKYKLGSIFLDGDYLLTAFSHFDDNNRAVLSLKEYVSCMLNFWDEIDQVYAGRSVVIPLMGSGITRFKDAEVQPQELLRILVWTFKISRVKFKHPANATIVIHDSLADKINLYELDN